MMAYPNDSGSRNAFRKRTTRARDRQQDFVPNINDVTQIKRGCVAGDILLRLLQLHEHSPPASVNRALPLVRATYLHEVGESLIGFPSTHQTEQWSDELLRAKALTVHIHRAKMLSYFREFRSVSHFWAALIIIHDIESRTESLPVGAIPYPQLRMDQPDKTPNFIATADQLAQLASLVPFCEGRKYWSSPPKYRDGGVLMPPQKIWRIKIPDHLRVSVRIPIPAISPAIQSLQRWRQDT